MKNQKPKTEAPASGAGPFERKRLVLRCDHRDMGFEYWPRPSELQLAHLAARLARTSPIDPKQLVNEAWNIYWESCHKIKEDYLEVELPLMKWEEELCSQPDDSLEDQYELPQPKNFPVTFQEMELLLLPRLKGRTDRRAALIREFIFAQIVDQNLLPSEKGSSLSYWSCRPQDLADLRKTAQDLVAEEFGELRRKVYDAQVYSEFGGAFLSWYTRWARLRNSQARAASALKGWEKRRTAKTARRGARRKTDVFEEALTNALKIPPPGA